MTLQTPDPARTLPPDERKQRVAEFWERASCGEDLYLRGNQSEDYKAQCDIRYELEPYILRFIDAERWRGKKVLEVGVGLGSDHEWLVRHGAKLSGIDLTARAIEHTRHRLALLGLSSELSVGDAEALPFPDGTFDMVYSWGVIHHSPDTKRAASEILRVLKPGGTFKVMIYHTWSLVGLMLWVRYALLKGRPSTSMTEIYAKYLESPGTKAYTRTQASELFADARSRTEVVLTHGDLLTSGAGQRHQGALLSLARHVWPRWLLRRLAKGNGLFLLIDGQKLPAPAGRLDQ